MNRGPGAFLAKHSASLLGVVAVAVLLALLPSQLSFHISADGLGDNQTLDISRGESQSLNLTISGGIGFRILSATPIGRIYLNATEVPAGLNVSVYPSAGCPPFHSIAAFAADDNATEGCKKIVLSGVGPMGEAERLEIGLRIVSTRFFELVVENGEIAIQQNKTRAIPVQIIRNPDYLQPISFKALGLPAGIVAVFDPAGSLQGANRSTLRLKINPEAKVGTYNLSVLGTSEDNRTAYCNLSLKIETDSYFTTSVNPNILKIAKGNDSLSSIELTGVNNYTGKVKLSVINYPKDIINVNIDKPIAGLSPSSKKDKSSLRLHASNGAIPGRSYYVVVNGLGQDGYSSNGSIMVIIEGQNGSFKIRPQFASLQLKPGESKNSEITIEGINEYEGTITLSASDLPGITANLDPSQVHIDSKNSIASSRLSLYAQADDDSAAKSDMIISGSDASQNSDECRIAIAIQAQHAATEQPAIKTQVAEPQSVAIPAKIEPPVAQKPAIEPEVIEQPVIKPVITLVIPPENGMPFIESIRPETDRIYSDQLAVFAAEANDPENDPIFYRFLHNGQIARDWSEKNAAEIPMTEGANEIEVQIIDGLHNEKDSYDDSKNIKIVAHSEIKENPYYENTTREEFFDEISAKEFNYNNIPIESISAGTRDRWYRNEPDSANYVGEYEIRKELFYSKSDYTIKLALDNQSRPIEVIFMQDSNIVSQVPSGFAEQAIRKLSNL